MQPKDTKFCLQQGWQKQKKQRNKKPPKKQKQANKNQVLAQLSSKTRTCVQWFTTLSLASETMGRELSEDKSGSRVTRRQ